MDKPGRQCAGAAEPDGWMICAFRLPVAKERKESAGRMLAMRKLFALVFAVALTSVAAARVWVTVYQYDGKTPLATVDSNQPDVHRDIMVGTRLTLVISSDMADKWSGDLELSWDDALYGTLSGRGLTAAAPGSPLKVSTYEGSCLDAAGTRATVMGRADSSSTGLSFDNDNSPYQPNGGHRAYPGDWFVVDYYAEQAGGSESSSMRLVVLSALSSILSFLVSSVRRRSCRRFPSSTSPRGISTAIRWSISGTLPGSPRTGGPPPTRMRVRGAAFDLRPDNWIDSSDLASFSEYWLERTDSNEPPADSVIAVKP